MPRRDGFPTNPELQATLESAGTAVYVAAFEHDLESKLPDYIKGKKLAHVQLEVVRDVAIPVTTTFGNPVEQERLYLKPIDHVDADYLALDYLSTDDNEARADRLKVAAQFFGETILGDETRVGNVPPESVITHYTAQMLNSDRARHVSTIKDRPAKQSLYAGIGMAEDSLGYVKSGEFSLPPELRAITRQIVSINDDYPEFSHHWRMPFVADLNINGYEPSIYLLGLIRHAKVRIKRNLEFIDQFNSKNAPQLFVENLEAGIEAWETAAAKAQAALDAKNRY